MNDDSSEENTFLSENQTEKATVVELKWRLEYLDKA